LRPTLSGGLPFSSVCFLNSHFFFLIYGRFAGRIFVLSVPGSSAALSLSRLRPVTLRATLSDGLPFSSSCFLNAYFCFLIYGRFAGRIFVLSVPGSSAALSLSRLRPVTLRATLSGGLLFSSFRLLYCNGCATE
jgi:hypothetical protein